MTKRTAITNTKGGAGKSSTTVNLAIAAVKKNLKVLVVDFDPQGSTTLSCGLYERRDLDLNLFGSHRIIMEKEIGPTQLAIPCHYGFDVIPSTSELLNADDHIRRTPMGDSMLLRAFNDDLDLSKYDLILFDTQGAPSSLLSSVINAADDIIIPAVASKDCMPSIETVLGIVGSLNSFRSAYGIDEISLRGHFFNNAEKTVLHRECESVMKERLGALHLTLFNVDATTKIKACLSEGLSIFDVYPNHKAVEQYTALFNRLYKDLV